MSKNKEERLAFIQKDLEKIIRDYEKKYIENISKWVELIDFISHKIRMNYDDVEDFNDMLSGDLCDENAKDKEYWFRLFLYMKILKRLDEYDLCRMSEFPKELENVDYWSDKEFENNLKGLKNKNIEGINCLVEFFDIYYKLICFYMRFITPIVDMLKYSWIDDSKYNKICKEFDDFMLELVDLALYKTEEIDDEDDELLKNIEDRIYWIKSIAYMYRIPIGTELMKLVDEHHNELYDDLDDIDYNKYYGYPDYNDK